MNKRNVMLSIIACAVIWLLNCFMFVSMLSGHGLKNASDIKNDGSFKESAAADSALKFRPDIESIEFTGDFSNPFKSIGEAFPPKTGKKSNQASVKLTLKGVLLKNQPLAIIVDDSGHTFICGIDEYVKDQKIEKICPDSVMLRNNSGSYTLTVKE